MFMICIGTGILLIYVIQVINTLWYVLINESIKKKRRAQAIRTFFNRYFADVCPPTYIRIMYNRFHIIFLQSQKNNAKKKIKSRSGCIIILRRRFFLLPQPYGIPTDQPFKKSKKINKKQSLSAKCTMRTRYRTACDAYIIYIGAV